jgi:hypothetical protein
MKLNFRGRIMTCYADENSMVSELDTGKLKYKEIGSN